LNLGLVGFPIDKSLSPVMHDAAMAHYGLEGSYRRFDAPAIVDLERAFLALKAGTLQGFNVTLPWKLEAARLCVAHGGRLVGAAARLNVVNTVVLGTQGGMLTPGIQGHNTDVPGLVAAIRERWPDLVTPPEPGPKGRACVIGAGGAAYAAVMAAHDLGFREIRVWNRSTNAAHTLVSATGQGIVVTDLEQATSKATLVVHATTLGMGESGQTYRDTMAYAKAALAPTATDARIVDLVYQPRPTPWVAAANELGREADDGLAMLIHQAALAFSHWTGHPPPVEIMREAAYNALGLCPVP
jgi:shikimate dehydrogenase